MTKEEHKARHVELHKALDELFADWIDQAPPERTNFLDSPIGELLEWSFKQTQDPTEKSEGVTPAVTP